MTPPGIESETFRLVAQCHRVLHGNRQGNINVKHNHPACRSWSAIIAQQEW